MGSDPTPRTGTSPASCAVLLDTFSRRVVGWSIDARPTAALVASALGMAIDGRNPANGVHPQSPRIRSRPLDGIRRRLFRQCRIESFWGRMQTELLNRQRWKTRVELANAMFD